MTLYGVCWPQVRPDSLSTRGAEEGGEGLGARADGAPAQVHNENLSARPQAWA